tara:strand:+ start:253 stop:459 length:207 start_codon:yes stop_codon:yes gene_type:complete
MTEEEREKISEMLLERMLKSAFKVSITVDDTEFTEFTERCKNFIATKTDEYLLTRLILGGTNVLSTDK